MNNKYDNSNIFAKILASEVDFQKVLENDYALAFLDINPQASIHILVIPKKAYVDFYDFSKNGSSDDIIYFWKLVNKIIENKNMSGNGFRIITNSGNYGNQDVPHFHIHLLGGENLGRMIN